MKYLMVLNDGETYTDLSGCKMIAVSDDAYNEVHDDLDFVVESVYCGLIDELKHLGHIVTTF